ncbi:MAG: hypothetical protein CVT92_04560 [Bacteroidetes bacterium HGW-Bacteroidetes-1]|jgi:squalene-hopene/tetraprenyl-beta-curcumene cyclase|nr:MAG: hypothetical protein CVT92_04560 [Bacteroidetes bacterium HGW-Bacteroidetes-1]
MKINKLKIQIAIILILSIIGSPLRSGTDIDLSLSKEVDHSIKIGLKWLMDQQDKNGSWQNYPAITALVLSSFLRAHPSITHDEPFIKKGFDFLISCVKPDGGIYNDNMPTYNTAICVTALKDAKNPGFQTIISNAESFLMRTQFGYDGTLSPDSLNYGGVGYGEKERADLSNLQWAIEALAKEDIVEMNPEQKLTAEEIKSMTSKRLFYDKALIFLAKCQNLQSINPEVDSSNDGGFVYGPGTSKAGGTSSYGSMTYAGLKSLIYAKVDKDDIRVKAAFEWISKNFMVEETPFMGKQGLYYYYQTMAKTLHAYGDETITDSAGKSIAWRNVLADQLIKTQHAEGFWINENGRWWENNPVLVTSYSILALEELAGLNAMNSKTGF